jgi:hypothetical protein
VLGALDAATERFDLTVRQGPVLMAAPVGESINVLAHPSEAYAVRAAFSPYSLTIA